MMYPYEVWAENNLVVVGRYGAEFRVQCLNPTHDDAHPSCYFNVEKGTYYCHSCGYRGSIANDPEFDSIQFKTMSLRKRMEKIDKAIEDEASYPDESFLRRFDIPTSYWTGRGLNKSTIDLFGLGYDAIADAVTIPTRDSRGHLYGVTRRFIAPDHIGSRYKYPRNFKASQNLFASWLSDEYDMSTVSIHEGAIDAMRMWQLNIPATALYGSSISQHHVQELLEMGVKKVVYFGDSDIPGWRAKERAKGYWIQPDERYKYKKVTDLSKHFLMLHITEYNNKKDAAAMTDDEILRSWESQEPFRFHGDTRPKREYINPRLRLRTK